MHAGQIRTSYITVYMHNLWQTFFNYPFDKQSMNQFINQLIKTKYQLATG